MLCVCAKKVGVASHDKNSRDNSSTRASAFVYLLAVRLALSKHPTAGFSSVKKLPVHNSGGTLDTNGSVTSEKPKIGRFSGWRALDTAHGIKNHPGSVSSPVPPSV